MAMLNGSTAATTKMPMNLSRIPSRIESPRCAPRCNTNRLSTQSATRQWSLDKKSPVAIVKCNRTKFVLFNLTAKGRRMNDTLEIINLHARIEEREILKGLDLTIRKGEVHAI